MSHVKKLLVVITLIILFITVYLTFSDHHSDRIFSRKHEILRTVHNIQVNMSNSRERNLVKKVQGYIDSNNLDNLKGYMLDEMMFGNIKAIDKVIDGELKELEKPGIKREKSDYLIMPKKKKKKKKKEEEEKTKGESKENVKDSKEKDSVGSNIINKSDNSETIAKFSNANIRLKYSVRNPRGKDLLKLSGELLHIEPVTDPLPTSAICKDRIFLTILVVSTPSNFMRRQFIRDTWGSSYLEDVTLLKQRKPVKKDEESITLKNMFRTVFVMGQTKQSTHMKDVYEEARLNKDIIFGSLLEDYKNLTMKTRLGLKWAFYDCDSVYVVKTDDDVFINPVRLVEWLKDMPRNNFYTGWCNFGSGVIRDPHNKWYVSREDFPGDRYPGYCLGGGYLMSNDVLGKVISASYGRKLFPMEDLYVGLMIDEMKEVRIQDEKRHFDLTYGGRTNDCDLNELFLAHQVYGHSLVDHIKRARKALTSCS